MKIKEILIFFLCALLGILFQGTILRLISPSLIVPNTLLMLVVYLAFHRCDSSGVFLSFALGIVYDIFGSRTLVGPQAASAVVVYCIISLISQRLFVQSATTVIFATFAATLVNHIVYAVVLSQFIEIETFLDRLLRFSLLEAGFTGILCPLLFIVLRFVLPNENVAGRRERRGWST